MIKVMIGTMKEKYFVCGGAKNGFYEKGERVALYQKDQKVIGNRPKNATVPNESVLVSDAPFSPDYYVRLSQSISDRNFEVEYVEFVDNSKELKELFKLVNKRNEIMIQMKEVVRKRKLSNLEKDIVNHIPKEYEWIARDKDGELFIFAEYEPFKEDDVWRSYGKFDSFPLKNIFEYVKWTDEKALNLRD